MILAIDFDGTCVTHEFPAVGKDISAARYFFENTIGIKKMVNVILMVSYLKHNESDWNVKDEDLMAMCQLCHLRYDLEEKKRRFKEKTPLLL